MVLHGPYPVGEPRVEQQAAAARRAGYDIEVVATRRPGELFFELVDGVRVVRLRVEHRRGGSPFAVLGEYLAFAVRVTGRLARRRYQVVQVNAPPDFLMVAALVPRLRGARVVLDVHDRSSDMVAMRFSGRLAGAAAWMLDRVERAAARMAHAVVTVHEPYRQALIANGVEASRISVVMNVVDASILPGRRAPDRFTIVYHGSITPAYGVGLLVEAFARVHAALPDATLELIGEGDALEQALKRARSLTVDDAVRASGRTLSRGDALERVAAGSVGVVPNLPTRIGTYALPTKLFEYVALGIPVVAPRLKTIEEHFGPDEIAFFVAGDASDLARALLAVAEDPQVSAARAAAAGRRLAEYAWPAQEQRYLRALGGPCAPAK